MSATTPVVAQPAKKIAAPKAKPSHPAFNIMIAEAIKQLNERSGSSKQAIAKYIAANHSVDFKVALANKHFKLALNSGVKAGNLKQVKGTGANGSFKVSDQAKLAEKAAAKKQVQKEKKLAAPKKAAEKPTKSVIAKKSPAKKVAKAVVKKAASPKKAATIKPKAGEEKPKKNIRKPTIVKAPVAKKPIAKKAAPAKPKAAKKAPAKPVA
jgi:histone H1/5